MRVIPKGRRLWPGRRLAGLLTGALALWALCGAATENPDHVPFQAGERLVFQVRWAFVPAGEAVLEVLPAETIANREARHFALTARTLPYIDPFYKVRTHIDAYTDMPMTHSILYRKRQEGKSRKEVVVTFDQAKLEARYADFGKTREAIPIQPGSFDPLSVFYAFRWHTLEEGASIEKAVCDGKKCVLGKAHVIKRERITVPGGTYDTYLVEPDLEHIGGVFKRIRKAKLQIWVTADHRRIPVRIESAVAVGSFVAELVALETGEEAAGAL
jgi:hypothetical protein